MTQPRRSKSLDEMTRAKGEAALIARVEGYRHLAAGQDNLVVESLNGLFTS